MSEAFFDLIYVSGSEGRTMSCAVRDGAGDHMIGPFPAKEAGPKIVLALMGFPELGFADAKEAETAYVMTHFRNMSRKENSAGQSYPFEIGIAARNESKTGKPTPFE